MSGSLAQARFIGSLWTQKAFPVDEPLSVGAGQDDADVFGEEGLEVLGLEERALGFLEFAEILLREPAVSEGSPLFVEEVLANVWAFGGWDLDALPGRVPVRPFLIEEAGLPCGVDMSQMVAFGDVASVGRSAK
ncbi:MAG: hypothetical protein U0Q16_05005 [Bryobacteraceae bacterium]